MTEFLIRVRDKTAANFYINTRTFKRGDVIDVCPDGWRWGSFELADPDHRILRVAIPLAEAKTFIAPEILSDPLIQSEKTLKWRSFALDLDHPLIPAGLRDWLNDDTRSTSILVVTLPLVTFRSLKRLKPITADPAKVLVAHG